MAFKAPNKYRWKQYSSDNDGNNGLFLIPRPRENAPLKVVASDGDGWEHVSVSLPDRTPTWEEMHRVKRIFWDPEDVVIQYHPAESEYVNNHENCLHMWRPIDKEIPTPNRLLIGL